RSPGPCRNNRPRRRAGVAPARRARHHGRMPSRPPVLVATLATPWGPLHTAASARGIAAIHLLTTRDAFLRDLARSWDAEDRRFEGRAQAATHLERLSEGLTAYLRGDPSGLAR